MKKQNEWLKSQADQARYDANERVSKGSDIGIIRYTRCYIWVGGSIMLFMFVFTKLGSMVDTSNPIIGIPFTILFIWAFWKLCQYFDDQS